MRLCVKKLNVDRKVKFWFKFGPYFETGIRLLTNDSDIYKLVYEIPVNREIEIFIEHTNEDQWSYDVTDLEIQLQNKEGFIDVNVVDEGDDSDARSEDCESFHDSDYPAEEDVMILDQISNSITESASIKGKTKKNQIC
ncbi:hypothetical protein KY285_036233 [Solanum tuberosum]|nr:hypothetical protein KY285_036233 [Solanum tuberosum]